MAKFDNYEKPPWVSTGPRTRMLRAKKKVRQQKLAQQRKEMGADSFAAPRKTVSASKRKKNTEISKIISDIMHNWEKTGMIGKNRPPTRKAAQKMAIAVAYSIHSKKAEEFNAPYTGSDALSDIGLSTDQLTSTWGSGDFDKSSLNSSGHMTVFANAEERLGVYQIDGNRLNGNLIYDTSFERHITGNQKVEQDYIVEFNILGYDDEGSESYTHISSEHRIAYLKLIDKDIKYQIETQGLHDITEESEIYGEIEYEANGKTIEITYDATLMPARVLSETIKNDDTEIFYDHYGIEFMSEEEEPEYPCDICEKPAKYNFQDTTVRYEIIDDDFENPKISDYGGQNQNDFYCEAHAKQYEGSDFHTLRAEEEEPEYPCDICDKPAKYNFQDTTVRYEIIDDDFENPQVSDYGGQNQNDFYCEVHAKQYEGSDFHTLRAETSDAPTFTPKDGYKCDGCGKTIDEGVNLQDIDVHWYIEDGDFTGDYELKNHLGNYNDFYCYTCAENEGFMSEGNTPVMPPMEFGEMANWRPLDGTPGLKRKRAENYKHECITCAEGMDELVAKGQTWSCECCGFLVGTQGKHEGCGYNDNGEVMCNLCATEQCDCAETEVLGNCKDCGTDIFDDGEDELWCDECSYRLCHGCNRRCEGCSRRVCDEHRCSDECCDGAYCEECHKEEVYNAPLGFNEMGPRPFYGNPRKIAIDRWGNRRFIRRRKDGTYMKNVDVGRSIAMDRRRQSQTWAPPGFRDQGDGSLSLLERFRNRLRQ